MDDRRGAALAVISIVLGVTLVALLIGLSLVISSASGTVQTDQVANAEPISDVPAAPYRLHYAWNWDDEDHSDNGYNDLVQCAHILMEARGDDLDRSPLAEGLSSVDGGNLAVSTAECLNRTIESTFVAVPIAYDYIQFLPAPCIVWIDDGEVRPVVFLWADEALAEIADPRAGIVDLGFSELSRLYDAAARQGVYVADRGYTQYTG